jgi:broad specificity phosphatase PhoE
VTAEHGPEALWLACTHGDIIKAIVADAMGLHLDQFQRVVADPASVSVIRYTATRPFLVRLNDTADLSALVPPKRSRRRPARRAAAGDAVVGGGAGGGA